MSLIEGVLRVLVNELDGMAEHQGLGVLRRELLRRVDWAAVKDLPAGGRPSRGDQQWEDVAWAGSAG